MIRQLLVSVALIAAAHCQTSRGTVTGTVLDSSGAVIKSATITLTSPQTGIHLTTASNGAGVYRFEAVDLGVYDLQVVHPGFQTYAERWNPRGGESRHSGGPAPGSGCCRNQD